LIDGYEAHQKQSMALHEGDLIECFDRSFDTEWAMAARGNLPRKGTFYA